MRVVHYEESEQWFLLEEDGRLFLNVRFNSGFSEIPRLFELNAEERAAYARDGLPFLSRLNREAVDAARDPFKPRNLPLEWHDKSHETIIAWRRANGTLVTLPPAISWEQFLSCDRARP